MPEFTPEQKRVIAHKDGNLLVSAAAGSGKTAVLVERILELVRDGADIASFLVVTFTRAAADELRQRLMSRLETEAEKDERMQEQVDRVELASISTIHAFCLQLISRYFEKAGVEPNLRTCSEAERIIFQERAMDTVLDEAYGDDEQLARLEKMGRPEQVRFNAESLYRFLMCQPDPMGWLEEHIEEYARDRKCPEQTGWFVRARELESVQLLQAQRMAHAALDYAHDSRADDCMKMIPLIEGDCIAIDDAAEGRAQDVRFATWRSPNKRGVQGSEELDELKAMRDQYRNAVNDAMKQRIRASEWEMEKYAAMEDPLRALADVTKAFMKEYASVKRDMGVMDYNDLEQTALRLTLDAGVCEDCREKYCYIFVDEYQDSSAVQETILSRISHGNNVFHVGDVKQSIYGFRQSDPSLFLEEQQRYAENEGGELIALNRNFRSLPNVLNCTNRVFERCMVRSAAGMDYDANARLYPGRKSDAPDPATVVQLIDRKTPEGEEEDASVHSEIEAVARLIKQLIGTPVHDQDGSVRPAGYGDIVVLRRAVMAVLPQYMECFQKYGIPVYAGRGGNFYETLEISQVMDYLWAIHNPLEDVHLLGALRGVGEFSAQELARIRLRGRGKEDTGEGRRMWTCLIAYINDAEDPALGEKAAQFAERLHRMRRIAREESISALCSAVLEDTGILSRFAAMPGGRVRVANLRSLPVRAAEYDAAGLRLGDFLRRIASTAARNREEDVPAFSENDDVVRIMTVHQSKGLEFPIVIGAGLGARFRISNDHDAEGFLVSRVWCDKDYGLALEFFDPDAAASDATIRTRAIADVKKHESIAEEMRILYVLMTRARERLALVGEVSNLKDRLKAWASGDLHANCMLDWIMPAVLSHPDAAHVCRKFDLNAAVSGDDSRWDVRVQMETQEQEDAQEETYRADDVQGEADAEILAQLQYVYPYPEPTVLQKQSVTEIAHGAQENFFVQKKPAFLNRERKLTGAERGSALHRFMEIIDFESLKGTADRDAELARQAEEAAQRDRMTREQADAVLAGMHEITRFLDGEIGREILGGAQVIREKPFEIRMDEEGQLRLVQGVIDLIVQTEDGAVIVDYKTDHTGLDEQSVRDRHGQQVMLYRQAAQLAGLKVKKCVVYLFYTGNMVEIIG